MTHQGGCHCGRIKFEVEGTIGQVIDCNCSMCQKRGGLLWFVPRAQFKLLTSETGMATYTFNTHKLRHRFCPACGIAPFSEGTDPKGVATVAINVRCVESVDPAALSVVKYDGRSR
ncbi:MAG: GFA family protein [Alphaproteobacteria bacterium]|nr:GFA family protein [Alphaproteobacteria bacterium]